MKPLRQQFESVRNENTISHRRHIKHTFGYNETDREEQIRCRQKWQRNERETLTTNKKKLFLKRKMIQSTGHTVMIMEELLRFVLVNEYHARHATINATANVSKFLGSPMDSIKDIVPIVQSQHKFDGKMSNRKFIAPK